MEKEKSKENCCEFIIVTGMSGSASRMASKYRWPRAARESSTATTQVSLSVRMALPKPCFSLICISGTTTAWMKARRVG